MWRRHRERYAKCCVQGVDQFCGGNVMVWGAFCGNARSRLLRIRGKLTAAGYRDQMLNPELIPFMTAHGPGLQFQHDNERLHIAILTRNDLQNVRINVLD